MPLMNAINIAQNGLGVLEKQIAVASSNITNADKPGYTRETYNPTYITNGPETLAVNGTIQSNVDENLNRQIVVQNSDASLKSTLDTYLQSYNQALGTTDSNTSSTLSSALDTLTSGFNSLTADPSSSAAKGAVVNDAEILASNLNNLSSVLQNGRLQANKQIGTDVTTINTTLDSLASLNQEINVSTADTNVAAIQNERDTDLQTLSGLIGIQYNFDNGGRLQIYTTSGQLLLSGISANHLSYTPASDVSASTVYPGGFSGIMLQGRDVTTDITSGELGGLIQLRDTTLPGEQAKLDAFTDSLKATVNAALNTGAALPSRESLTGSTTVAAGDPFAATGSVRVALTDSTGKVQSYTDLNLSAYATVGAVVTALNGIAGITASIDANGNLNVASTDPNLGVSLNEMDSSVGANSDGFSNYFGLNNLFDSNNGASDVQVSSYLQSNPNYLASGVLDSSNTLAAGDSAINAGDATTLNNVVAAIQAPATFTAAGDFPAEQDTLSAYTNSIISSAAVLSSNATTAAQNSQGILSSLQDTASNTSGVNIDQETANSAVLQNSYSATAKIISTVQTMFDALLQAIQ